MSIRAGGKRPFGGLLCFLGKNKLCCVSMFMLEIRSMVPRRKPTNARVFLRVSLSHRLVFPQQDFFHHVAQKKRSHAEQFLSAECEDYERTAFTISL
jgi:hypothetical protein